MPPPVFPGSPVMCGRFASTTPARLLAGQFAVDDVAGEVEEEPLPPRWNVAPTAPVYAVLRSPSSGSRRLETLKWGLVPSWAKNPSIGSRFINARAETVQTTP